MCTKGGTTMEENQLIALISLLDDQDAEVLEHVESKIRSFGPQVVPFLEAQWATNKDPILQQKLLYLTQEIQFESFLGRLQHWYQSAQHDLLQGLWAIATYHYPSLSLSQLVEEIEQYYYQVWVDFVPDIHPVDQVRMINNTFFNKLQFRPNTKDFHAVANSMINQVMETKKGNPISLCAIYMLIARKLDLPVYGVNLPNLFILTYQKEGYQFYINAFNKGLVFSKTDIDNYIAQLNLEPRPEFYEPCTHLDIIKRVLRNLYYSFEKHSMPEKARQMTKALALLGETDLPE